MRVSVDVDVPNALLFVMDHSCGVLPDELVRGVSVWATSSCVAVGTLAGCDGSTHVAFDDQPMEEAGAPQFDGTVLTPTKTLSVCTVLDEIVLSREVDSELVRVRIWTNHPTVPDRIVVVVSKARREPDAANG